jgi:predicted trehalose synthase
MPGRRETSPGLDDLAARRASLAETLRQVEDRSDGAAAAEAKRLRGELQALDQELRLVAGAS